MTSFSGTAVVEGRLSYDQGKQGSGTEKYIQAEINYYTSQQGSDLKPTGRLPGPEHTPQHQYR